MSEIVVGYDGSDTAGDAVRWAVQEAGRRGGVPVHVLYSTWEPALHPGTMTERWDGRQRLEAIVALIAEENPGIAVDAKVVNQHPAEALAAASQEGSLVVVGARGLGGFGGLLVGSVSRAVAARGAGAVVVTGPQAGDEGGHVVVGVDGSEASRAALAWAAKEAEIRHAPLRVVLAWNAIVPIGEHGPEPLRATCTDADARITAEAIVRDVLGPDRAVDVVVEAVAEQPAAALIERAAGACLLVVGTHPPSAHRWAVGSVASQVLHHGPCPVALVHAPPDAP